MREVLRALLIRQQHGDRVVRELGEHERVDAALGGRYARIDSENGSFLVFHRL